MTQYVAANPSIWVGNLDARLNEPGLYDFFSSKVGPVSSVRVCVDPATQKSLGYGYVNFHNPTDAEKALDETGSKLLGKHIRVSRIQRDPSKRRSGVNNIVVKKLPPSADTFYLKELFSKFGRLTAISLATDENGESRGYARIAFEREESAVEAVQEMNGTELSGQPITVERYQPHYRDEQQKNYMNLYVKNLDPKVSDEKLKKFFSTYGEVTSCKVRDLGGNDLEVGFGYVAYSNHEAAAAAVEATNEKECEVAQEGVKLSVSRFRPREERRRDQERRYRERQQQYSKYPNLYVKNFDDSVTSDSLKALFERYGPTISARVMVDPETKISRCFGFVSMKEQTAASRAINELHGSTFLGVRPLFVTYAMRKDMRRQTLEEMRNRPRMRPQAMGNAMGGVFPGNVNNFMPPHNPMYGGMPMMNPRMPMVPPMGMNNNMRGMGAIPPQQQIRNRHVVRPPMQQAPQQAPMQHMQPPQMQNQNLPTVLATLTAEQQKNVLGERLYTHIVRSHPNDAAKVTGMLLEMDNSEILNLLDTPSLLDSKISEALDVLRRHINM